MGKMSVFRNRVRPGHEAAPWEGPFAPAPPTGAPKFDRMLKTAAELVGQPSEVPAQPASASVAA
jgi:hypothetical protein